MEKQSHNETMEPDIIPIYKENIQLKQIIREYDMRIFYLEKKLNLATEYVNYLEEKLPHQRIHHNICHYCKNTHLYDEIMCDCNMFCDRTLCNSCYSELQNESMVVSNTNTHTHTLQVCHSKLCRTWTCSADSVVKRCKICEKDYCYKHYSDANIHIQNWICISCCEKVKDEYGYESV